MNKTMLPCFKKLFLLFMLCLLFSDQSIADQQQITGQEQSLLVSSVGQDNLAPPISTNIQAFIDSLDLDAYEAAVKDLSICHDNERCLRKAKRIKNLTCSMDACNGKNAIKDPLNCYEDLTEGLSSETQRNLSVSICSFLSSPNAETRNSLLKLSSKFDENELVEYGAYTLALESSAKACEKHIKKYLSTNGLKWDFDWSRALSGCRILTGDSTKESEEKDFYTWFGFQRRFSCTGIMNPELNAACQTPAVTFILPSEISSSVEDGANYLIESQVEQLRLDAFQAATKDLSLCQNDEQCLTLAQKIKTGVCVNDICSGKEMTKQPADCFQGLSEKISPEINDKINSLMCPHIKSPDSVSRQELMRYIPEIVEDDLVEMEAYYLALNESAGSCQNYVKFHVGPFGPQWNYKWYRALSGCRLIGGESTLEQEKSDFYTWLGVGRNFNCSQIVNKELSVACQDSGEKPF